MSGPQNAGRAARMVRPHRPAVAVWGLALWLTVAGNLPLWQRLHELTVGSSRQPLLFAGIGLLVAGATAALLSLAAWPRVFRPVASLLAVIAAVNSHFMWQYGAVIDSTMLANVVNTDVREVRDLMSWSLPLTVLLVAGPPLWWIWRRPLPARAWFHHAWRNAAGALFGMAVVAASVMLGFQDLAPLVREQKSLRYMINPLNAVYAGTRLALDSLPAQTRSLEPVGEDARLGASYHAQARPPLLMIVVGETARARNWGLNGYARQTTPALARWQAEGDLVNFSNVRSCGTNTHVSVPCMFSPLTREEGGDRAAVHENLLDVLHRAGLAVLWIDNQSGCKGVCARVSGVTMRDAPVPGLCDSGECLDEAMLEGLDARIAALEPERRARGVVLVMHQMGSHGPAYFKRTPPDRKPFQPECTNNMLSDCPIEHVVNAYDNTIAETDRFLDLSLRWLQARAASGAYDTALLYMSDHGESLGEGGLYLHGLPFAIAPAEQIEVPMVAWLSPGMQARSRASVDCLRARSAEPLSHDNLFHSVLGLMHIETGAYRPSLDALAPCSAERPAAIALARRG
ncbi:phosphoethanolamine--lipid A transferase [Burkholderiaceae bacterium FT117]|uniref:phosphoethanolamine transferase n=1 Tax=Zeimonas sediminis TaxID=2944268 RepID=UPI002342FDFF|nr:phosphoethanolamine--lipid A transferase [Zeimonas sediminis]MCM5569325.1 phosphoethanolamine--lipid A transferase [Zeimonas sediminis]